MCIVDDLKFIKKCLDDEMLMTAELILNDVIMQVEQQEPVAWRTKNAAPPGGYVLFQQYPQAVADLGGDIEPLYKAQPKREWQGLTDEEIDAWNIVGHESLREFVRSIEAKLKEKNT